MADVNGTMTVASTTWNNEAHGTSTTESKHLDLVESEEFVADSVIFEPSTSEHVTSKSTTELDSLEVMALPEDVQAELAKDKVTVQTVFGRPLATTQTTTIESEEVLVKQTTTVEQSVLTREQVDLATKSLQMELNSLRSDLSAKNE